MLLNNLNLVNVHIAAYVLRQSDLNINEEKTCAWVEESTSLVEVGAISTIACCVSCLCSLDYTLLLIRLSFADAACDKS